MYHDEARVITGKPARGDNVRQLLFEQQPFSAKHLLESNLQASNENYRHWGLPKLSTW